MPVSKQRLAFFKSEIIAAFSATFHRRGRPFSPSRIGPAFLVQRPSASIPLSLGAPYVNSTPVDLARSASAIFLALDHLPLAFLYRTVPHPAPRMLASFTYRMAFPPPLCERCATPEFLSAPPFHNDDERRWASSQGSFSLSQAGGYRIFSGKLVSFSKSPIVLTFQMRIRLGDNSFSVPITCLTRIFFPSPRANSMLPQVVSLGTDRPWCRVYSTSPAAWELPLRLVIPRIKTR